MVFFMLNLLSIQIWDLYTEFENVQKLKLRSRTNITGIKSDFSRVLLELQMHLL